MRNKYILEIPNKKTNKYKIALNKITHISK